MEAISIKKMIEPIRKKMPRYGKEGKVIEDVFLPKETQDMVYCDLIVSNDSLYIKETRVFS